MQSVNLEEIRPGVVAMNGREFMISATGGFDPIDTVKDQRKLEDDTVRKCIEFAEKLNAQISRFRGHTVADLGALDAILAEKYNTKIGGKKGNRTYQTYDGLMQIKVQVADEITFGPELQVAKNLIDACLIEWSADSRPEIQLAITSAFNTDKEGQVNRANILKLLTLEISDERWVSAMEAIRDAIRITGSKEYVRFYRRENQKAAFTAITIDLAKA